VRKAIKPIFLLPRGLGHVGPPAHPGGWKLVFAPTQSGSRIDPAVWSTPYPWGHTNFGKTNVELEWYVPSQVEVSDGALHLVALRKNTPGLDRAGRPKIYQWRSGVVTTYRSFHFTYGYVQAQARIPAGAGYWSAIWLHAYTRDCSLPEIDLEESSGKNWYPNGDHRILAKAHFGSVAVLGNSPKTTVFHLPSGWNTFGLDWEPNFVAWYVDGHRVLVERHHVPTGPMYLIANLAIDGNTKSGNAPNGTTPPTGSFDLRDIKVWQH
jgi:beta-glucanase (GH16 family)